MSGAPYRDPARPSGVHRRHLGCKAGCSGERASTLALGSLAVAGATSAFAFGSLELAALAGAGAIAAVAHLARARRGRGWRCELERVFADGYLVSGGQVTDAFMAEHRSVGEGAWTSPCGTRRLRARPADDHLRLELLDPASRRTLTSRRVRARGGPTPARERVQRVSVATVHGRALAPCCVDERGQVRDPVLVRLLVCNGGVLVERLDRRGALIGDTRHDDVLEAQRQLAHELGTHLGVWRTDERVLPTAPPTSWEGGSEALALL